MELNDMVHDEGEKASVSLKIILLIFALVVVGTLAFFVYKSQSISYDNGEVTIKVHKSTATTTATVTATATARTSPTVTATSTATTVTYTNTKYNFSLTFPASWSTYKIKTASIDGAVDTFYVNLPTTDTLYKTAGTDHYAAYAAPCVVGVMNKADWTGSEDQLRDYGAKVGENSVYVFTMTQWQANPTDLSAVTAQISAVIDSFRLN